MTSELLFEAYGVPQVSLGTDALFSAYDALGEDVFASHHRTISILSSGQNGTYVIPLVDGSICKEFVRRFLKCLLFSEFPLASITIHHLCFA